MLIRTFGVSLLMLALAACSSVENPVIEYTTQGGVGEFAIGVQHDMYASTFANELGTTDRVFFAFDSAVLDEQAEASVRLWADLLASYPEVVVVVEGHCDERGGREYNLALGERRADAVKALLVELGIDPSRIATVSYGKERPALGGHDEAAWSQNRRAVLVPG